jgi:hypothetical protein
MLKFCFDFKSGVIDSLQKCNGERCIVATLAGSVSGARKIEFSQPTFRIGLKVLKYQIDNATFFKAAGPLYLPVSEGY